MIYNTEAGLASQATVLAGLGVLASCRCLYGLDFSSRSIAMDRYSLAYSTAGDSPEHPHNYLLCTAGDSPEDTHKYFL